jgi:tetratricopeptide (TPR) repeat protein
MRLSTMAIALGAVTLVTATDRCRQFALTASGESWQNLEAADPQRAEAAVREALKRNPSDPQLQQSLAQCLSAQGKPREAEAALRRAATQNPNDPSLWLDLAQHDFIIRDYDQAAAAAKSCLNIAPYCLQALMVRAFSLEKLDDKAHAVSAWREVAKLDPGNVVAVRALKRLTGTEPRETTPVWRIASITTKWH